MEEIIELNEFGLRVWRCRANLNLFVSKEYRWVDRVLLIDESKDRRKVLIDVKFSEFGFDDDWIPVTKKQYGRIKKFFKDIYLECPNCGSKIYSLVTQRMSNLLRHIWCPI